MLKFHVRVLAAIGWHNTQAKDEHFEGKHVFPSDFEGTYQMKDVFFLFDAMGIYLEKFIFVKLNG